MTNQGGRSQSHVRASATPDHSADAMLMLQLPEGRIKDVNEAACRMLSARREELVDQPFPERLGGAAWVELKRRLYGGDTPTALPEPFRFDLVLGEGVPVPFEWIVGHLAAPESSDFAVVVARDLRKRLRIEAQLHQNQRIESIGRLAGGIAHDFNNLLAAIMGYSEIVESALHPEDPLKRDVMEIVKATEKAGALTSQLLAFSRRQVLQPTVLELNDVVRGFEPMLRRVIGEDIELQVDLDEGIPPVKADRSQIEQVVMNLVVNARDAMQEGGQLVVASGFGVGDCGYACSDPPESSASCAWLSVRDTGCGMEEDTLARIFEPFFTTKIKDKGTGLGLATVYGIVRQSGGTISVDSALGEGSSFTVCLPPSVEPLPARPKSPTCEQPLLGQGTILVVEDEEVLRRLIGRQLRHLGFEVLFARHGGEALLLCEQRSESIVLVLTDIMMPQMRGDELARRLREQQPEMRTLFMSGYDESALSDGALLEDHELLRKPFNMTQLGEAVRRALGRAD